LRPWTIPNLIGVVRALLIGVFLVLEYGHNTGHDAIAAVIYAFVGGGDYLDGIAARITGQYSRLGAMLDPLVDRLYVAAGGVVCWSYGLLAHWALGAILARELLMLAVAPIWVRRGLQLNINWIGRIGVAPTMFGLFLALAGARTVGGAFFIVGVCLAWLAAVLYLRSGIKQLHALSSST
jgi:cardiolipin synthase